MHFELVDLRLLDAIAATGSLSKAAATFPVAVSAASNRLRQLEQRCGLELFVRRADGMSLTPNGRLVLERARAVLAEAQKLSDSLRELAGLRRITLRLSATTVANSTFLPATLGAFLADYPEVDLQLVEEKSSEVLRAVQAGESEIGVYDGNLPTTGLVSLPFRDDKLVMLVYTDHPLAARQPAEKRDDVDPCRAHPQPVHGQHMAVLMHEQADDGRHRDDPAATDPPDEPAQQQRRQHRPDETLPLVFRGGCCLRLGGGLVWQGPRIIGNQLNRAFDYIRSDSYRTANLSVGYTLRVGRRPIELQFNVTNLFDHADPIYSGTQTFGGQALRALHYYLDPRKAALAATSRF